MSETDSFINEVTEEVRRDKLFALFRKYGWIAGLAVVLIVGGAAVREWRIASAKAAAQKFGDAVITALKEQTPKARAKAVANISTSDPQARIFLDLLSAAAQTEASDPKAALAMLDKVASNSAAPFIFRQLAKLKAVILQGANMDKTARLAALDKLATAGNPFRVIALEQKALALHEYGENDKAIAVLRMILEEPTATQGLLQRAQQLIVALGGDLPQPGSAPSGSNG